MKSISDFFRIRGQSNLTMTIVLGLLPLAVIFLIWTYITTAPTVEQRIVSSVTLPSPIEVGQKIIPLLTKGKLMGGIIASTRRVFVGFAIALALALPLGIAMGSFGKIREMFNPLMLFGGYLPIAALVPLTLVWFGTEEYQKYMFLAIAFFVYLLPLVVNALDKVDNIYLQTAATLGASRLQVIRKVLVPIAFYDIWHAMRLAVGIGWSYIILVEVIDAEVGLGKIIIVAQRQGPREYIYLVIIIIALLAWLIDKLMGYIARKLFPYKAGQ